VNLQPGEAVKKETIQQLIIRNIQDFLGLSVFVLFFAGFILLIYQIFYWLYLESFLPLSFGKWVYAPTQWFGVSIVANHILEHPGTFLPFYVMFGSAYILYRIGAHDEY
jgi:hypothetical protein